MKLIESDNKKWLYTKNPSCWYKDMDRLETDTSKMYLGFLDRMTDYRLLLHLNLVNNGKCTAAIEVRDRTLKAQLDSIEKELRANLLGASYKKILDTDFELENS